MTSSPEIFSTNSIRSQLLLWMLGPLLIIGSIAIIDGYRAARSTANAVSDRVLSGSALAIAERVFVNGENGLEVDIPYVALQMLTSLEDDRVFYKIEKNDGGFITGYRDLALPETNASLNDVTFADSVFRGAEVRIATFHGAASSTTRSFSFRVAVAETTNARVAVAQSILIRSLLRQGILLLSAAILIWLVVSHALKPLRRLEMAVSRRSPDDVRPIEHSVPQEVQGLVFTINGLVERFSSSIKALQNFTSNASHQFRTPLSLIKTHLEVAVREKDPAKQIQAIDRAGKAVNDAERLMYQMLLLAQLDAASKQKLQEQKCDLTSVARDACNDFILQLSHNKRSDVDLGFHTDGDINVRGDKTLIQEIVRNLIDNAIKHSGSPSHIDVEITANNKYGILKVSDQGCGFDEQFLASEIDEQLGSLKNADKTNFGLGLSIVKDIVKLHGGKITARRLSLPTGMSVIVKLPLTK
ncbi:sensor histidine kinase [Ahrensia sp. 13_GOM-1096m]|uniref:sensor histidine kinase n=1 Tax=Ahrensia sp. 13_GOM-1096m TaxID=1380380 RepID=UPI000A86F9D3|nr:sensor histidine kinase [Ahrensia sp. 13_GOM-1096m]